MLATLVFEIFDNHISPQESMPDPSELLQTLEDKTDQLKRQLVKRNSMRSRSISGETNSNVFGTLDNIS